MVGTVVNSIARNSINPDFNLIANNGANQNLIWSAFARRGLGSSAKQFEAVVSKLDKTRAVTALVRRGDTVNFLIIRPVR